jgi:hypothetical protein
MQLNHRRRIDKLRQPTSHHLESTKTRYLSPTDRPLLVAVLAVDAGIQALTILSLIKSV